MDGHSVLYPPGSKFLIFEVSGSKNHRLNGFWTRDHENVGFLDPPSMRAVVHATWPPFKVEATFGYPALRRRSSSISAPRRARETTRPGWYRAPQIYIYICIYIYIDVFVPLSLAPCYGLLN